MRITEYSEAQTKMILGEILFPLFEKWMCGQTVIVRNDEIFYHSSDIDKFILVAQDILDKK
jgi:hypothetical protein